MALPLIGLTVLTGYLLNNDENTKENTPTCVSARNAVIPNDLPVGKNIYTSNMANEADFVVLQKSKQNYLESQDPAITGILPPLFNTYSINGSKSVLDLTQPPQLSPSDTLNSVEMNKINEMNKRVDVLQSDKKIPITNRPMFNPVYPSFEGDKDNSVYNSKPETANVNPLTGLPYENIHKNMVPYFGGSLKQNVEKLTNTTTLDLYTGKKDTYKHKKEVGPFYTLQKQDIHGTPNVTVNLDKDRFIQSNYKQNEKPFYEERVAAPISGTVDNKIRSISKNVDELRYASKPKLSFKGRTVGVNLEMCVVIKHLLVKI